MFEALEKINQRPEPFQFYTAGDLWTDAHTPKQMLAFHLDAAIDVASRNHALIDRSVEWIASTFDIGRSTRVVDFGCGPGLYAERLARSGADVTGIDFSPRSIAYAKEVAARERLNIRYLHQDYLEFDTDEQFDLVLMIMCDFCALSPVQRKGLLRNFHRMLTPGGAVVLDVYSLSAFEQREEAATYAVNLLDGFWLPSRYYGFLNTFKYEAEKVILDKYTIVAPGRTSQVYNWLQYFSPEAIQREFAAAAFCIKGIYADVAGTPYRRTASEFAVIAQKS